MMYCLNFNSPLKKQERDWHTVSVSVIVTRDVTLGHVSRLMTEVPKNSPPEVYAKVNSVQFLAPF